MRETNDGAGREDQYAQKLPARCCPDGKRHHLAVILDLAEVEEELRHRDQLQSRGVSAASAILKDTVTPMHPEPRPAVLPLRMVWQESGWRLKPEPL